MSIRLLLAIAAILVILSYAITAIAPAEAKALTVPSMALLDTSKLGEIADPTKELSRHPVQVENMLANGDFEAGNTSTWIVPLNQGTISLSTTAAHGLYSGLVTATFGGGRGGGGNSCGSRALTPITPNTAYTWGGNILANSPTFRRAYISVIWYVDCSGNTNGSASTYYVEASSPNWQFVQGWATSPSNAHYAMMWLWVVSTSSSNSVSVNFDDIALLPGDSIPTPTNTPVRSPTLPPPPPTATRTHMPVTNTPVPTSTPTFTPTPSDTPIPTDTPTPIPPRCPSERFTDVCPGDYFYQHVLDLNDLSILTGYNTAPPCDGVQHIPCFKPYNNSTRGQIAKVVSLAAGFNEPVSGQTFEDVQPNSTFYEYVERMALRNTINGYPCGDQGESCVPPLNRPYFRPGSNVSRGQLTKMVILAFNFSEPVNNQTFEDVLPDHTFYTFIERLAGREIINGYSCGGVSEPCVSPFNRPYFRPSTNITRGQISKIVNLARAEPTPTPTMIPTTTPSMTPTLTPTYPTQTSTATTTATTTVAAPFGKH